MTDLHQLPRTGAAPAGSAEAAGVDDRFDTYVVALADLAGRLVGKRLTARHYRTAGSTGVGICDVVFGWGIGHELLDGFDLVGWEHGYGDILAVPDQDTLRPLAWWPRTAMVMADAVHDDGRPVPVAPRTILRAEVNRAAELGLRAVVASELEFTLLDETARSLDDKRYTGLRPHGVTLHPELVESTGHDEDLFGQLRAYLLASGVPVESVKAEYSRGQFELVMGPDEVLASADTHALYKLAVREISRRHGLTATFMAKWDSDHGGSSCHLHVSLRDGGGSNVFADSDDRTLRHFIGGLQRYAPDVFLLWAPYPNSYKRFRPRTFAPSSLSWGQDNRTAALRVTGTGANRHLENRIPGADVNPYLAYAGLLAAGLAGIEQGLLPDEGVARADAYARTDQAGLPSSLDSAIDAFTASEFARERFGAAVVEHIANFSAKELAASRIAVTDWDRRRLIDI